MKTLNETVRRRRQLLGLSLAETGRRARISKAYLHRLERPGSEIRPSIDVVRRLAEALGLDPVELVSGALPGRILPVGLREYAEASGIGERDVAALAALAPFADEEARAADWGFAYEALQRSILRATDPQHGD